LVDCCPWCNTRVSFKTHLLALFPWRLTLNSSSVYNHTEFSKYNFLLYTSLLCIFCPSCLKCLLTGKCLFQSLKLENPSFILLLYSNLTLHKLYTLLLKFIIQLIFIKLTRCSQYSDEDTIKSQILTPFYLFVCKALTHWKRL